MHSLAAITPLGEAEPHVETWGEITVTEITDRAIASVTARAAGDFAARAGFLGDLPGPGQWRAGAPFDLIWTGPDQWFVTAAYDSHPDLATVLKTALGDSASVTEQTDGWVRFDVTGEVVDMMERLCPLPVRRMTPGQATRSIVEHIGCLVIRSESGFALMAPRSYAASLLHALRAAAIAVA